ncbi:Protein twisted gastrulation [Nymphon striatum]|nr:Protein twisted gastrulation [Nymphon striatum]
MNICPQPNITEHELHKKSHVEDLNDPIPDLFDALTLEKDELLRWSVYKFPTHKNLAILSPGDGKEIKFTTISSKDNESPEIVELNCTVAYMSKCLSWNKCKASCLSMGASSYRWFHDGCCECVGHKCINYGIGESRCLQCPPSQSEDSEFDEIPIEETEYGLDNAIGVDDVEAKELYIDKNHHKASKSQKFEDKKPLKRAKSE